MRSRHLLKAAAYAAGSFVLGITFLLPPRLDADSPAPTPAVVVPKLITNGAEITVSLAHVQTNSAAAIPIIAPGDPVELELVATNTTDTQVELPLDVSISSMSLGDRMSRVMPTPKEVWKNHDVIVLGPKQCRTITLKPSIVTEARQTLVVSVASGQQSIWPLRISVRQPLPQVADSDTRGGAIR